MDSLRHVPPALENRTGPHLGPFGYCHRTACPITWLVGGEGPFPLHRPCAGQSARVWAASGWVKMTGQVEIFYEAACPSDLQDGDAGKRGQRLGVFRAAETRTTRYRWSLSQWQRTWGALTAFLPPAR